MLHIEFLREKVGDLLMPVLSFLNYISLLMFHGIKKFEEGNSFASQLIKIEAF
jgi:hypothetical protein